MKKYYFTLIFPFLGYSIDAQVGINTSDPQATLHVEKRTDQTKADGIIPPRFTGDELRAKSAAYGAAQNGAIVYVTESVTATTDPKTSAVLTKGLFVYDAFAPNGGGGASTGLWSVLPTATTPVTNIGDGAYAAKFTSTFTLLGLNVNGGVVNLNLGGGSGGTTTVQVPSTSMNNGTYTVPSTGLYHITYDYKEGSGASVSLLTNSGIRILRKPFGSSTTSILESKGFGGVNALGVLTVSITQTMISHIYSLNAGDQIQFAVNRQSFVALEAATVTEADVSIYRIR
jgi:hypothetical protein